MARLQIPVTKSKGGYLEVDTDQVPIEVFEEAVKLGFKDLFNRGASKVTAANFPDEEERKQEAMVIAQKQLEAVMSGNIRFSGGRKKKAGSRELTTEANRLAKLQIKDAIKAAGGKIGHYKASEITKLAKALLEGDEGKEIWTMAEENLKKRSQAHVKVDLSTLHTDPELVAKAEAKKVKRTPASAKQAGMVQHRARPEVRTHQ